MRFFSAGSPWQANAQSVPRIYFPVIYLFVVRFAVVHVLTIEGDCCIFPLGFGWEPKGGSVWVARRLPMFSRPPFAICIGLQPRDPYHRVIVVSPVSEVLI